VPRPKSTKNSDGRSRKYGKLKTSSEERHRKYSKEKKGDKKKGDNGGG
jgi:hypothetical protein